ncbi:MAG: VWA domain-containing protein, partial [Bacteroidia bacterium]
TKTHLELENIEKLQRIDEQKYQPNGGTPLYDAIGQSVNKLRRTTDLVPNCNVLVTILTDGEENASREYSGAAIKALIEEMKEKKWTFTYIGTEHDVEKVAHNLSINNTMKFDKSEASMSNMFIKESKARHAYFNKISNNENVESNYYEEI